MWVVILKSGTRPSKIVMRLYKANANCWSVNCGLQHES